MFMNAYIYRSYRYIFLILLGILFCRLPLSAATSTTNKTNWVLAAQKYSFAQKGSRGLSMEQFATVLPQLILAQIAVEGTRVLPSQEVLDRKLDTLQTERLSLFLQLSKEYQTRDALVVNTLKPKKLEKDLAAAQKKIDEIQKKIDENLEKTEKEKADYAPQIKREAALARGEKIEEKREERRRFPFPFFMDDDEQEPPQNETVVVYKNDSSALFSPSETAEKDGITSRAYEKELGTAKINGLLSGSIRMYGDYVAVTTELRVYPGAKLAGTVTEVGTISDQMDLAERIVQQLVPVIANSLPVQLHFEIMPEEIAEKAHLTLDGLVYSKIPTDLQVDASIHTINVLAKGYDTASFTYKFEGNERYTIRISLSPAFSGVLNLRLKKLSDGVFHAKGLDAHAVDPVNSAAPITVNGKAVLGIYTTGEGENAKSAFFYIPDDKAMDGANLKVNIKPFDRAQYIDKRRRWLYTSYTALILSMPFTFYVMGNSTAATKAYKLDKRVDYDEARRWEIASNVTAGISIACGVWFAYELVRYLIAANEVLPATATVDKRDFAVPTDPAEIDVSKEVTVPVSAENEKPAEKADGSAEAGESAKEKK